MLILTLDFTTNFCLLGLIVYILHDTYYSTMCIQAIQTQSTAVDDIHWVSIPVYNVVITYELIKVIQKAAGTITCIIPQPNFRVRQE